MLSILGIIGILGLIGLDFLRIKIRTMDETIEKIVRMALKEARKYGDDDQYTILNEASQRLMDEAQTVFQAQYLNFNEGDDDYEGDY